jgi:exopolysaccharide production protein ExoZ
LIRVAPLYWIATTLTVALLLAAPRAFSTIKLDWRNVLFSYLFLLSPNSNGEVGTVTQTGWSLCYEAYFYLLFGVLLTLPRRYFLAGAAAIFGFGLLIGLSTTVPPWATVVVRPILIEFYLGALVAFLFLSGFVVPWTVAIFAIVLGVATILLTQPISDWMRVIAWGLSSCAILGGAVSLERFDLRLPKILLALGASSYSLYLVHPLVLPAFGKVWSSLHLASLPAIVPGALAFAGALAVAHAVYLWVERPLTEWLKTRSRRRTLPAH